MPNMSGGALQPSPPSTRTRSFAVFVISRPRGVCPASIPGPSSRATEGAILGAPELLKRLLNGTGSLTRRRTRQRQRQTHGPGRA